jgi:hypothetical protein
MWFTKRSLPGFLAVTGAAALALLPAPDQPAVAATLSLNFPNCSSVTLSDAGGGNYTVNCGTAPTTPGAPTNCFMSSTAVTSGGGNVTLAASCGGTTGATTWAWTKGGVPVPSATTTSWTDSLPPNTGTSPQTYTYGVTACNGNACAPGASLAVTVPAPGGTAPPPTGPISCAAQGFSSTTVIDLPWINTSIAGRILSNKYGSFGPNGALVIRFTVPAAHMTGGAYFRMAEWGGGPVKRRATLSQTPCDFSKTSALVDMWESATISPSMLIGGTPAPFKAHLTAGQTYYLNLRNLTCAAGSCDMFLDFAQW